MGEQTSLEFDLTFSDVLFHKLVQAYLFKHVKISFVHNIQVWADSDSVFQYLMIIVANGYENTFLLTILKKSFVSHLII